VQPLSDAARIISWLQQQKNFGEKTTAAVADLTSLFAAHFPSNVLLELMTAVFQRGSVGWERCFLLQALVRQFQDDVQVWQLIRAAALKDLWTQARYGSLELLAYHQKDDSTTWQLIYDAATKHRDLYVRGKVCRLLLQSLGCSELQNKLMSNNHRYWYGFGHDLKEPITSVHATDAAKRLNLSVDEVRQQYEAIAAQLPVELILEWRKGH
jgi:hypothetical protein